MEGLCDFSWGAAEVSVGSGFEIYGVAQVEAFFDCVWCHGEYLTDDVGDACIGKIDMCGAFGVDVKAYGLGNADGIGYLDKSAVADTGCHEVLGDMACCVSGRAVDFGGVFA